MKKEIKFLLFCFFIFLAGLGMFLFLHNTKASINLPLVIDSSEIISGKLRIVWHFTEQPSFSGKTMAVFPYFNALGLPTNYNSLSACEDAYGSACYALTSGGSYPRETMQNGGCNSGIPSWGSPYTANTQYTNEFSYILDGTNDEAVLVSDVGSSTLYLAFYQGDDYWCSPGTFNSSQSLDLTYTPTIVLTSPADNATTTDFIQNFWRVDIDDVVVNSTTTALIRIDYSLASATSTILSDYKQIDLYPNVSGYTSFFNKNNNLCNAEWVATPKLYINFSGWPLPILATISGDSNSFTIENSSYCSGSEYLTEEATCTKPTDGFLDDPIGNIGYGICKAFTYLFVPNDGEVSSLQETLSGIQEGISSKPPFGYVILLREKIADIVAESTTSDYYFDLEPYIGFDFKAGFSVFLYLVACVFAIKSVSKI